MNYYLNNIKNTSKEVFFLNFNSYNYIGDEIEENTYIADTPGFSSFEISEIESTELDKCFREFVPEIEKCEFVGCTHIKEENCGVKKAMQEGRVSTERYERYCKIYSELKEKEKYKW